LDHILAKEISAHRSSWCVHAEKDLSAADF
jgi:hypothetical protein